MADDITAFPTAIVPTRPGSVTERWDRLARVFGDPLAKIFHIQATTFDEERALRAAAELLPYRYPKLKSSEIKLDGAGAGAVNVQINFGAAPPQPPTVDVSPVPSTVDPLS